jgi:signal transduction histidine kinase
MKLKLVFYRVAQEALNNIAKHSGARKLIFIWNASLVRLNLCIQDDGLGF